MYHASTFLFLFMMLVFPCAATEAGCTECSSSQPETSSLLQAKVLVNPAMHGHALEVATAVTANPVVGLKLLEDFASNAIGMDMAIDNSTMDVIYSINKSLEAEVVQNIMDDHALDVNATMTEVDHGIASCNHQFTQDSESDTKEGLNASLLGEKHRSSRENLKDVRTNQTDHCTKMKNTVTGVPSYDCEKPIPPLDDSTLAGSEVVENFKKELEDAIAALKPFDDQKKSCIKAIDEQEAARNESRDIQTSFESSMCTWLIASMQSCSSYQECYQSLQDNLAIKDDWLVARVQHRKLEFETVRRIQCILKVFVVDTNTTLAQRKKILADCQTKTIDVSHLNITIPKLPEKQPCNMPEDSKFPGSAVFHDSWYKDSAGTDYPDLQGMTRCVIPPKLRDFLA